MNIRLDDTNTNSINLTVEFRFANGLSTEFHQTDEERVREALHLLAAPTLFSHPHLLLGSQLRASMIPCKGIDMILARTSTPLPLEFPLKHPAGQFDFVAQSIVRPDNKSAAIEDLGGKQGQPRGRSSQVEIHTLGGWTITLEATAIFHGNILDERQFFSQLPNLPSIPFRLEEGGFGLINTVNIVCVSASPKPEGLPGIFLPLTCTDGFRRS